MPDASGTDHAACTHLHRQRHRASPWTRNWRVHVHSVWQSVQGARGTRSSRLDLQGQPEPQPGARLRQVNLTSLPMYLVTNLSVALSALGVSAPLE